MVLFAVHCLGEIIMEALAALVTFFGILVGFFLLGVGFPVGTIFGVLCYHWLNTLK